MILLFVSVVFISILVGMAISVGAFGTGGKRAKIFEDIYFSIEEVDGIGVVYTKKGDYSAILKMENPVRKYSADTDSYYEFTSLMASVMQVLGDGYAIHKQDIFVRKQFDMSSIKGKNKDAKKRFLSDAYFRFFNGRSYTEATTYLTITQKGKSGGLKAYDNNKWRDFNVKIQKVADRLKSGGITCRFLGARECQEFADRFFAVDFKNPTTGMTDFKVDSEEIGMGDQHVKVYSLLDVDNVGLPGMIRPYNDTVVNNSVMPEDLLSELDHIPGVDTVIYNQVIFFPNQKREMAKLDKKKNRHASIPNPSNLIAVEDIKAVQDEVARNGKQLVYAHYNLVIKIEADKDFQKVTNNLENIFAKYNIHISKRAYNQLELFVASFPGNCFRLNQDYDQFLTISEAALCLMYKEHQAKGDNSPLKCYYTDRQGVPVAIDISGKEGRNKLTDNSNFFVLGPSGSGKSFYVNSMVRQAHEQDTDIVLVDTGNSYEGLCEYFGGKYISYTEEHPITMNPFKIKREEWNIEKLGFLKNLVMLIWKGSQGTVSKTEDRLIEQVINEYYDAYFTTKRVSNLCFNTFYEFSTERLPKICEENGLHGIDLSSYNYLLKDFYKGGSHDVTLNENMDSSLFDETFIVFEIDSIKDDPLLFPLVTLIIMDVFLQKMRIKKNRKMLIIEEAWKAIASPMMAEYIKYLYKTARKFWASVGVVTQEIQDIIGSEIVKEAIINNSDVVMLLDQSKFKERFDTIKAILGLTDVDCKKIFTINRLENKEGRSFFREVFIRRGQTSNVYGVEEPHECYMTYTTERAEKEALKLYKRELKCNHQQAIEAYCRDWDASGISKSLAFAQKVNQAGKVLNLGNKNKK